MCKPPSIISTSLARCSGHPWSGTIKYKSCVCCPPYCSQVVPLLWRSQSCDSKWFSNRWYTAQPGSCGKNDQVVVWAGDSWYQVLALHKNKDANTSWFHFRVNRKLGPRKSRARWSLDDVLWCCFSSADIFLPVLTKGFAWSSRGHGVPYERMSQASVGAHVGVGSTILPMTVIMLPGWLNLPMGSIISNV